MNTLFKTAALCAGIGSLIPLPASALTVYSQTGADAAAILATVDAFRADLGGPINAGPCGVGCTPGVGRREINWDGVPDNFASGGANPFPGNFFNLGTGNPAGRVRGAQFSTTGAFEVSADPDSDGDGNPGPTATLFGNHTADNSADFAAFSAERIFGLVGTNQMDVTFSIPGSPGTSARVSGFGAVFTDVEVDNLTRLEFFDANNVLLTTVAATGFVPNPGDTFKSFSFIGATFDNAIISRVHIVSGSLDLDLGRFAGFDAFDAVAMDDFIYGEPVPLPAGVWLLGSALFGLRLKSRRR